MYFQKKESGFSLVETLVAISILLIVIVGPMTISMRTAKSSSFASEQIQAFFLAQEGIEMVQKSRDDLLLQNFLDTAHPNYISNPWSRFTSSSGTYAPCFTAGCSFQWVSTPTDRLSAPISCSTVVNCLLYRDNNGRAWFTHTSGGGNVPTIFTRRIYFSGSGAGIQVRSVVTWRTGSIVAEQRVEVDTYLYNIYGTP